MTGMSLEGTSVTLWMIGSAIEPGDSPSAATSSASNQVSEHFHSCDSWLSLPLISLPFSVNGNKTKRKINKTDIMVLTIKRSNRIVYKRPDHRT